MPPKKWDESSEDESTDESVDTQPVIAPAAVRRKFDDEEDSEDVADNWDEEEDSDVEREKAKKAAEAKAKADAEAARNKKSKAQRIEEHREANRLRRAAEDDSSDEDEDEAEKRARLKRSEKDADLSHAQDLLGDVDLRNKKTAPNKALIIEDKANPGQAVDLSTLPLFQPKTKTQFDQLSEVLGPLLRQSSAKPHFSLWMPNFAKAICQDMNSADVKKVASALTALSNEKMKEEKAQEKGGKKSKAAKSKTTLSADRSMGRGSADTTAYDDDGLDDGDFM